MNYEKKLELDIAWNDHLSELIKFKQQWGHCDVPQKYANNPKLGGLVIHHRSQYRLLNSGKKSFISNMRLI